MKFKPAADLAVGDIVVDRVSGGAALVSGALAFSAGGLLVRRVLRVELVAKTKWTDALACAFFAGVDGCARLKVSDLVLVAEFPSDLELMGVACPSGSATYPVAVVGGVRNVTVPE